MRRALQVAATGDGTRAVMEAFDGFRAACGLAPGGAWEMGVALDEVLSNAVSHGCAGGPGSQVEVVFELLQGAFEITVVDHGPPFNPLAVPPPDTGAPLEAEATGRTRRLPDQAPCGPRVVRTGR